jgi:hypothetical protein
MDVDGPNQRKKKRTKGSKGAQGASSEAYLYHLEDEMIANLAGPDYLAQYAFNNAPSRGQMGDGEDFGVEMRGRLALVDRSKLKTLIADTESAFSS